MKSILRYIFTWYNQKENLKKCLHGSSIKLSSRAKIYLQDGAVKNQLILGDDVWLYGSIILQNKGMCKIGNYVRIGNSSTIQCVNYVEIRDYVIIADNVVITDNNNHPTSPIFRKDWAINYNQSELSLWKHSVSQPTIIEDNVWIGANVRICKGVKIGSGSIVAASAVVTKDVPPYCIVAGNPARVVKMLNRKV